MDSNIIIIEANGVVLDVNSLLLSIPYPVILCSLSITQYWRLSVSTIYTLVPYIYGCRPLFSNLVQSEGRKRWEVWREGGRRGGEGEGEKEGEKNEISFQQRCRMVRFIVIS